MNFPSLTGPLVFYRSYSRQTPNGRETWKEVCDRTINGLKELGKLTDQEANLLYEMQSKFLAMSSGRWLWVGGTEWSEQQENFSGAYNCSSTNITDWESLGMLMDLAMMGCGTGAVLLPEYLASLPVIKNRLKVTVLPDLGSLPKSDRLERTKVKGHPDGTVDMWVGDSRQGWVESYQKLLDLSSDDSFIEGEIKVVIHLESVRPAGERLEGFGGVANPVKLSQMYERVVKVLNKAVGRQLNSLEVCLLIDEAAVCIVAGSIRRSAGMRQFDQHDELGADAKDNLWQPGEDGTWRIDPERDALRMANHSRVFHQKPTLEEVIEAVRKQFYSGEGAIQWAGEALARANEDLLDSDRLKQNFLAKYSGGGATAAKGYLSLRHLEETGGEISDRELEHRSQRFGLNPCLHGDTLVKVWQKTLNSNGWTLKPIRELAQSIDFWWVSDGEQNLCPVKFQLTRRDADVIKLTVKEVVHLEIYATPDHTFFKRTNYTPTKTEKWDLSHQKVVKNGWEWERTAVQDIEVGDTLLGQFGDRREWQVIAKEDGGTADVYCTKVPTTRSFDLAFLHSGNCGEIIGSDYHCNLSEVHLNQIDPFDFETQKKAFTAAGIAVASLLQHKFAVPRYQESRELDPIVGVSFTGLFNFFVNAFGVDWLHWWEAGMPKDFILDCLPPQITQLLELFGINEEGREEDYAALNGGYWMERVFSDCTQWYLTRWKRIVQHTIWAYCDRHNLKRPNRYTTVQPAGSKSLLTGASPGWHPPFGKRYIRRITFAKNDPVALACLDAGYSVVPGQSDKDENGVLLTDPYDPRVTEWLVEVPVEMPWANLPGMENIEVEKFGALPTFDFYMQVQKHWTMHNTSATILFEENEIEPLGQRIYKAIRDDEGYISAALLAKNNAPFPRLPFEAIDKQTYDKMVGEIEKRSRTDGDFGAWVAEYSLGKAIAPQDSACEGLKCEMSDTSFKSKEYMPNSI